MDKLRNYNISFAGLPLGMHTFDFKVNQAFFDLFEFEQEFSNPEFQVKLNLEKFSNMLNLELQANGTIDVHCDLTDQLFSQPMSGKLDVKVKFSDYYDDSDDEVWVLPHGEGKVNIAQLIFELILLHIPQKHIAPNVDEETLNLLDKYSPEEVQTETDEEDPRWEALKKLKKQ